MRVAAIRSDRGASRELLVAGLRQRLELAVSVPLMIEYEAVMTRRDHLLESDLTAADIGTLLDTVAIVAERVRLAFLWRPALPDANDDMVLETAINGHADWLVTFNQRDFATVAARFEVTVGSPGEALTEMRKR